MKNGKTSALLITLTALLSACSNTPVATQSATTSPTAGSTSTARGPNAPSSQSASAAKPASPAMASASLLPAYLDPNSGISKNRSVYFDFDSTLVKPEFSDLVMQHGKYLMENPKLAIRIEGNTDERGGSEYNLALGQKRAEAVRQALKLYGVTDAQVEAVSWGEERPRAKGHDEADWQQNRRADLQYPGK